MVVKQRWHICYSVSFSISLIVFVKTKQRKPSTRLIQSNLYSVRFWLHLSWMWLLFLYTPWGPILPHKNILLFITYTSNISLNDDGRQYPNLVSETTGRIKEISVGMGLCFSWGTCKALSSCLKLPDSLCFSYFLVIWLHANLFENFLCNFTWVLHYLLL